MLQAANTDLFNPLVPKAHNREFQNILFPLKLNHQKVIQILVDFHSCTLCTNGLNILYYLPSLWL